MRLSCHSTLLLPRLPRLSRYSHDTPRYNLILLRFLSPLHSHDYHVTLMTRHVITSSCYASWVHYTATTITLLSCHATLLLPRLVTLFWVHCTASKFVIRHEFPRFHWRTQPEMWAGCVPLLTRNNCQFIGHVHLFSCNDCLIIQLLSCNDLLVAFNGFHATVY